MSANIKPKGDFYPIEGELYPRVTGICKLFGDKEFLMQWMARTEREACIAAAVALFGEEAKDKLSYELLLKDRIGKEKAGNRASEKARNIGKQAHAKLHWLMLKMVSGGVAPEPPEVSPEAAIAVAAGEEFIRTAGVQPILMESTVWSKEYKYAGTLDMLCNTSDGLVLLDWKTSKYIYDEHRLQVAAYRHALNEMGHGPVNRAIILRLPKSVGDPPFQPYELGAEELDKAFDAFLGILRAWSWMNERRAA